MEKQWQQVRDKCSTASFEKLQKLNNPRLFHFIADAIDLCAPRSVYVCDDSKEDLDYVKHAAIKSGEETPLVKPGQTYHFDSYYDQARDKTNTRYLLLPGQTIGPGIDYTDREAGTREVRQILKGSMAGKEMIIKFFCLGPVNSLFSIPCVQVTDSYYVIHSESILYRNGYATFQSIKDSPDFFRFLHSAGRLENAVCVDLDKRRIFIDLEEDLVYSVNTQYAGNSVGLKKLAMRLAIHKSSGEGWLTEHMFIMGVRGTNNPDRLTYFTGAFPSACGKTSTSMLGGETIIGDDIAYIRVINGEIRAANVEAGIFGIIEDVNSKDDPTIYEALIHSDEVIFNNILVTDDKQPYWSGKDGVVPSKGINHSGSWTAGKKDEKGKAIPPSHKNARYTISLSKLANLDKWANATEGVRVGAYIYGGRDSDTTVPVEEAFDFEQGVITKGASIESETTAATLGKVGVRTFNLMSNLDFLSIPFGRYIQNNLDLGRKAAHQPKIFSVNYFLTGKDGKYLNGKRDKHVWLKWMELRVNNEAGARKTPMGFIPKYEDLKELFRMVLGKGYTKEAYLEQFTIRIPQNLAKLDRIEAVYRDQVTDTPKLLFRLFAEQRSRLIALQREKGDYVSPELLEEVTFESV